MEKYLLLIDKHKEHILNAFHYIWANPETGYKEWKTNEYLKNVFLSFGYALTEADNIPGFFAEIDTGRKGPTVGIFAEMDAVIVPTHPEAHKDTGAVHACGHCAQTAAIVGLAAALKEPNVLDNLSGKIRLIVVPAEEGIELEFRRSLLEQGVIQANSGKSEFIRRGMLDGVDLSFMMHTKTEDEDNIAYLISGSNGYIAKNVCFEGFSAHAALPERGINALYAANTALTAINALRETFQDQDHIRVHPIISAGGSSVNAIPDNVKMESYIRGANLDAMLNANRKVNRAIAASAAAIGAKVKIIDAAGAWPRWNDRNMVKPFREAMEAVMDKTVCDLTYWNAGCSDMGDMASIMPTIQGYIGGAEGTEHGSDYSITNPETTCVKMAKIELLALVKLLESGAEQAKKAVSEYKPYFKSKEEYIAFQDKINRIYDAVQYQENGNVILEIGE